MNRSQNSPLLEKNFRKNTQHRNIIASKLIRLDSTSISNGNSSSFFPRLTVNCSQDSRIQTQATENDRSVEQKQFAKRTDSSVGHFRKKNNFQAFMENVCRNTSSMQKLIHTKASHRIELQKSMNTSETNVKLVGMTKIDDNKPPRITRLLHAFEDKDSKQSKDFLQTFIIKNKEKEYSVPRKFDLEEFKLQKTTSNIPQIKSLMCHFINKHKRFCNKDVIRLPKYEKTAPFFIDTMNFADNYLDDQNLVKKSFGYDEENLKKNHLLLENIYLERLIKKEKNIPDKPQLSELSSFIKQIQLSEQQQEYY